MRILLDTSVLVAAMVEAHPVHEVALPWLQQVKEGRGIPDWLLLHFRKVKAKGRASCRGVRDDKSSRYVYKAQ